MNRGKDRRRHTLTSLPHTLSRRRENHHAGAVNARACTSSSITHIAEKKKINARLLFDFCECRKRERDVPTNKG